MKDNFKYLKTKWELNEFKFDLANKIYDYTKKIYYLLVDAELEILDDVAHHQYADLKDWFDCNKKLINLLEKRLNELRDTELEEIE